MGQVGRWIYRAWPLTASYTRGWTLANSVLSEKDDDQEACSRGEGEEGVQNTKASPDQVDGNVASNAPMMYPAPGKMTENGAEWGKMGDKWGEIGGGWEK